MSRTEIRCFKCGRWCPMPGEASCPHDCTRELVLASPYQIVALSPFLLGTDPTQVRFCYVCSNEISPENLVFDHKIRTDEFVGPAHSWCSKRTTIANSANMPEPVNYMTDKQGRCPYTAAIELVENLPCCPYCCSLAGSDRALVEHLRQRRCANKPNRLPGIARLTCSACGDIFFFPRALTLHNCTPPTTQQN